MARARKLEKTITASVVTVKELETGVVKDYDFKMLPADIQEKFGPFGLGHRLGDAAAAKTGAKITEAIDKVWEGLMAGNWAVRTPAGEQVTKKSLTEKVNNMSEKDAKAAKALLAKLNIVL